MIFVKLFCFFFFLSFSDDSLLALILSFSDGLLDIGGLFLNPALTLIQKQHTVKSTLEQIHLKSLNVHE